MKEKLNWFCSHRVSAGLALFGVVALSVAAVLMGLGLSSAASSSPPRLVLFSQRGELDSIFSDETAKASGFTVAHTWEEFKNDTNPRTQAVVFTNGTRNSIEQQWLRGIYRSGVVIVGVNVSAGDLADMVGDPDETTSARGIVYSGNFFSEAYRMECNGGGGRGLGSYPMTSASEFDDMLEIDIAQYREICDQFTQTPTPSR